VKNGGNLRLAKFGTLLALPLTTRQQPCFRPELTRRKVTKMYTARFFSTQLGRASLASVGAMIVMCCFALTQQVSAVPVVTASSAAITGELA